MSRFIVLSPVVEIAYKGTDNWAVSVFFSLIYVNLSNLWLIICIFVPAITNQTDFDMLVLFKLLGSLALLMFGMKSMSDALQKMAGPQLRLSLDGRDWAALPAAIFGEVLA